MQTSVNTVVKNLFQKNSLQELTEQQLQEYVHNFPYSSIGHLLLVRKKKEEGTDYVKEAAIAALYVNNPLWLHCLLNDEQVTITERSDELEQTTSLTPEEAFTATFSEVASTETIVLVAEEFNPTGAEEEIAE